MTFSGHMLVQISATGERYITHSTAVRDQFLMAIRLVLSKAVASPKVNVAGCTLLHDV